MGQEQPTLTVYVRKFPTFIWDEFKVKAIREGRSVREALTDALAEYVKVKPNQETRNS